MKMSRYFAMDIMHAMAQLNWKQVNEFGSVVENIGIVSWETVLEELTRRISPNEEHRAIWDSSMMTAEDRKQERRRFTLFVDAMEGTKMGFPMDIFKAWVAERIPRTQETIQRIEGQRVKYMAKFNPRDAKLK